MNKSFINQLIQVPLAYFKPQNFAPWLDQKNALSQLEKQLNKKQITSQQYDLLKHWTEEGYIIVKDIIPETLIDNLVTELDQLLFVDQPIEGLRLEGIQYQDLPSSLTHGGVLALPDTIKTELADSIWRIHAFHERSLYARQIFDNSELQQLVSLILGKNSEAKYTINFRHGTEQNLHEDMSVFYINPANYLVGVWIALEDISEDSGPLVYCPGSHKEARVTDFFPNYPAINLKNIEPEKMSVYSEYVNQRSQSFPKREFIARKGDILLWHGMLIHGGTKINNPALTRKSMVIHFVGEDCDCSANAKGSFNW